MNDRGNKNSRKRVCFIIISTYKFPPYLLMSLALLSLLHMKKIINFIIHIFSREDGQWRGKVDRQERNL